MKFRRTVLNHRMYFIISGLWFFGLLFGLWISFLSRSGNPLYDNCFLSCHLSVTGIFLSTLIPMIAVLCGILFRLRWLICIVIFAEAFLYGFNFHFLTIFGGALFRSIQMFSNSLALLLMVYLCLSSFNHSKARPQHLQYFAILAILFNFLDIIFTISLSGG